MVLKVIFLGKIVNTSCPLYIMFLVRFEGHFFVSCQFYGTFYSRFAPDTSYGTSRFQLDSPDYIGAKICDLPISRIWRLESMKRDVLIRFVKTSYIMSTQSAYNIMVITRNTNRNKFYNSISQ